MTNRIRRKTVFIIGLILLGAITNGLLPALLDLNLSKTSLYTRNYRLCSVITASKGEKIFFGGNIDNSPKKYSDHPPRIFFFPPREGGYGFVTLGLAYVESKTLNEIHYCGINEKGLTFGTSGLPEVTLNPHPDTSFSTSDGSFRLRALRECSNISCVIELAENIEWESMKGQYHFADATGNAVVISPGKKGELAFTHKNQKKRILCQQILIWQIRATENILVGDIILL